MLLEAPREFHGDLAPGFPQNPCGLEVERASLGVRPLELSKALVAMLEVGHFPPEGVAPCARLGQRRSVLPLDSLEQREALLDLLQPARRGIDTVAITAQEIREIFELRLDAVPRVEVRLESGVERRELANPFPHGAELREHGGIALVQRGVAFGAQPLDPLGARQHLTGGLQIGVLFGVAGGWRLECRLVELGELEGRELLASAGLVGQVSYAGEFIGGRAHAGER